MSNTRDMTKAEFDAAIRRNGFRHEFMGWYADTSGQTKGVSFGAVYRAKPFKMHRRATLARLLADRKRHAAQQEAARAKPISGCVGA